MAIRSFLKSLDQRMRINANYVSALLSGYGLMAVTIVVQLLLVPLYLQHLGREKFGILLMIFAGMNYAAVGVGWLSGGLARILAECAAEKDFEGFRSAYVFSKWMYFFYSLLVVLIFWTTFHLFIADKVVDRDVIYALILASASLLLQYEYNGDRAAFNALHWQSKNNAREIVGNSVFALLVMINLNAGNELTGVIFSQIAGILVTRVLAANFWANNELKLRWERMPHDYATLWRRLTGKMGKHYAIYAVLFLTLQADTLLLGWLLGPSVVASLFMIWRIPEVIVLIIARIPNTFSPFLIALDACSRHTEIKHRYNLGLIFVSFISFIAAISYCLIGHRLIELWVGSNAPVEAWSYIWASIALFFLAVTRWPIEIAYSLLNTKPLIIILGIEVILKAIFIIFAHDAFGHETTVIGTVVIYGLFVFYMYLYLGRVTVGKTAE